MKFLIILLLFPMFSTAQETSEEKVYDYAEVDPSYPGGREAMTEFIVENVEYPEKSRENGEQGIVYVKFVVGKDGTITHVGIRKGVCERLDAEAMRLISGMPQWIPGEQNGKPVAVNFTLPIHFRLTDDQSEKSLSKKEQKKQDKAQKKREKAQRKLEKSKKK